MLKRLLKEDRSIRRFDATRKISYEELEKLVELTRYCSSGRNLQPLRYRIVHTEEEREKVYPLLKWAGYLTDWDGPEPTERPVAYLVQCLDTKLAKNCLCDDGLQLQAITLGARSLGIGGCIIKAFNAPALKEELGLEEHYEPRYVLALGYPVELVELEDMSGSPDADYKYYRTTDGIHHVPKRILSELIL
ncbi:MAG: nitroreductase family protein [Bacteroides sp.]|nr:nitroreductase family protein [Bacteroides sp.]